MSEYPIETLTLWAIIGVDHAIFISNVTVIDAHAVIL